MESFSRNDAPVIVLVLAFFGIIIFSIASIGSISASSGIPAGVGAKNPMFHIFGLFAIGIGYFIIHKAKAEEGLLYKIQRLPPVQLEDATEGVAMKVHGKITCKQPLSAPYSGKPCVWSRSLKEVYVKSGKSGHWQTVEDKYASIPFQLDDGTGKIWVNLEGATAELMDGVKASDWRGMEGFRDTRKTEWILPPENAFVYGLTGMDDRVLSIMKSGNEPLVASHWNEDEFLSYKRSDDKLVNALGYGMMFIGIAAEAWLILG